jgi:hypothetical protein
MPRRFFPAAALAIVLASTAHAEQIILCGWDTVFIVDTPGTSTDTKPIWTWNAKRCEQIPESLRRIFATTDDCKPVDGGSKILISSSSGGCALVERPSGKAIWYAQVPNAHSLELLPRSRIIVASSVHAQGNRLVLFDLDHSDQPIWSTLLVSAHGVVRERASSHRPDGLCPGHRVLVERYRGPAFPRRHAAIAGGAAVQSEMASSGWIEVG